MGHNEDLTTLDRAVLQLYEGLVRQTPLGLRIGS